MDQEPSPSTLRERKTTTIVAESDPKALIRNPPIRRPTNATNGDLESQAPVQPGFRGWLSALLHPNKAKERNTPPLRECLMNIVKYSYLNILLLLIPVSWIMHFTHQQDTLIFVFSFLSIIPLAALLGFATEELALRVGPTLGGLLNATFGNAVELIIAIIALKQDQLKIVQASMLGSFLSNCLLVLGMCFFAGGLRFHEQAYGTRIAQQQISLLSLSVFSVVVPAAFVQSGASTVSISDVTAISRGTAIVLLICYAAYLVFQLYTHKYLYTLEASKLYALDVYQTAGSQEIRPDEGRGVFHMPSMFTHSHSSHEQVASTHENGRPSEGDRTANHNLTADGNLPKEGQADKKIDDPEGATKALEEAKEEEEEELPQLKVWLALVLLVFVTVITGVTAEFLVSSIDGMTTKSHVNKEFVALILLPLVGNAAEHVTAVTVSVKNKLDLAMGVAIGSSIQIFLFVLPFMVVLAWGMDKPLTLAFDVFETVVVALAIIVVSYAIADGRTNWLEGFVLMVLYVIIAIATWFHKADGLDG